MTLITQTVLVPTVAALIALAGARANGGVHINELTGTVKNIEVAVPAAAAIRKLDATQIPGDIDLKRMAQWAMNYLVQTPRKNLNYEPVFQCHPLRCPPSPEGQDPVVSCDTDARLDWE